MLSILFDLLVSDAILWIILGTAFGIIIGAIPGLGAAIGIAVMLPFTYSMEPVDALVLLAGIFMGCGVGGAFSGVLINVPGTNEAICTTIEGYPMALRGEGKKALYVASVCSFFGGVFGCIVLILFAPTLARVALKFGPAEMAITTILGLIIIAGLAADNLIKGIFGSLIGMLIACVGIDAVAGVTRFTFGQLSFTMGFKQVAIALGLIAGRQMIAEIRKAYKAGQQRLHGEDVEEQKAPEKPKKAPSYEQPAQKRVEPSVRAGGKSKTVSFSQSQMQVVIVKPDRFEDVTSIADHLNLKKTKYLYNRADRR